MNKIIRQPKELEERLKQQIELLDLACDNFDNGKEIAGLTIATIIRILVHDTEKSNSLLKQLSLKDINFFNTARPLKNYQNNIYLGLIIKFIGTLNDKVKDPVLYKPTFTSDFHYNLVDKTWISFNDWREMIIFSSPNGAKLSRKQLVLYLSNQEGGAHIDPKIDKDYDVFRHHFSGGMLIIQAKHGKINFDNIPVFPSVRQIAFEFKETLKNAKII